MTTATAAQLSDPARVFVEAAPHKLLIGEEWVEAASGETFETIDPATGDVICEVAKAGAEDVDRAVKAAQAALDGEWSQMPASGRERLMQKLADLVDENAAELAELEALDNGKPVTFAGAVDVAGTAGAPALLRRLADQDRGRDDPGHLAERVRLHAQGAGRRLRPDHPVELPAADGGLEDRARARRRLHGDPEARRADAAHRAAARPADPGGRASRRAS